MRRLILNADDFGLTEGVNQAIVEAHTVGVLTSATLMANAPASRQAADLARAHPKLGIGCHVVLVDGEPLTDSQQVPSLTPTHDARFRNGLSKLAASAVLGRLDQDEIESEATAQFRRLQGAGIQLTHFDTHKHAHMFASVLEGLLSAACACGIGALRNPFEPAVPLSKLFQTSVSLKRTFQTRALRMLRDKFMQLVNRAGLKTTLGTVGIAATGSLNREIFQRIVNDLPDGTWEFVFHPGYCDNQLKTANTRLLRSRETELHLLTAPETRAHLERAHIELISYADL